MATTNKNSNTTMEVDPTNNTTKMMNQHQPHVKVAVHPLAIVNMSDQYTRITLGGTPFPKTSPVTGLLFGIVSKSTITTTATTTTTTSTSKKESMHDDVTTEESIITITITDADDIPIDESDVAKNHVALHQAVFPQHTIVGWYRVVTTNSNDGLIEPDLEDLVITQRMKRFHQTANPDDQNLPFLFSLLQVTNNNTKNPAKTDKDNLEGKTEHNDDDDNELPLSLYYLPDVDTTTQPPQSAVLIGIEENWKLDTMFAERIAVERSLRDQQQQNRTNTSSITIPQRDTTIIDLQTINTDIQQSVQIQRTSDIQDSIQALQYRLTQFVEKFLMDTANGTIPSNRRLVRQIYALVLQHGVVSALSPSTSSQSLPGLPEKEVLSQETTKANDPSVSSNVVDIIQQLTALSKTIDSLQSYTDKIKAIQQHETKTSSSTSYSGTSPFSSYLGGDGRGRNAGGGGGYGSSSGFGGGRARF